MTATAILDARAGTEQLTGEDLQVRPQDIDFYSPRPGIVVATFTIRNNGTALSRPTVALVRSAPLGAFVPWQPLDQLKIPALLPGESFVIEREYRVAQTQAFGGAGMIPPDQLLSALGLGAGDAPRRPRGVLPPDPLTLLGRGGLHWAGNFNIFFPNRDAERHLARALRMYPGQVNVAQFVVGSQKTDLYKFRLTGDGAAWSPCLLEARTLGSFPSRRDDDSIVEGQWYRPERGVFHLFVTPPEDAETGRLNVHVCQKSTGREALVEFSLDSSAAGPGCYVV
ncbi:MAG: hypothetical protein U0132_19855 [Gemmatimonadaceae bacterium]